MIVAEYMTPADEGFAAARAENAAREVEIPAGARRVRYRDHDVVELARELSISADAVQQTRTDLRIEPDPTDQVSRRDTPSPSPMAISASDERSPGISHIDRFSGTPKENPRNT